MPGTGSRGSRKASRTLEGSSWSVSDPICTGIPAHSLTPSVRASRGSMSRQARSSFAWTGTSAACSQARCVHAREPFDARTDVWD